MSYNRILLHVPHASTEIPHPFWILALPHHMDSVDKELHERSFYLVDYYTDELFVPTVQNYEIKSLIFDWNRVVCDVERLPHDPLEVRFCGIYNGWIGKSTDCYANIKYGKSMRRYVEHNSNLAQLLADLCFRGSINVLLIDCHSFSLHPTELCPNPPADIDICIGYNEDWSKPNEEVISLVERHFSERGYRVARNTPFSNSKTVEIPYYYHSIMIEVSKRLYMNEETLEKTDGFVKLQKDLQDLYPLLLTRR